MPLATRLLPREEFPRLKGTELERIAPILPPHAQVIVVEDGEKIVGCWALYYLVHAEGVWIAPEHRGKVGVARRLVHKMFEVGRGMGAIAVNTAALSDEVAQMAQDLGGVEVPGRHFAIQVAQLPSASASPVNEEVA